MLLASTYNFLQHWWANAESNSKFGALYWGSWIHKSTFWLQRSRSSLSDHANERRNWITGHWLAAVRKGSTMVKNQATMAVDSVRDYVRGRRLLRTKRKSQPEVITTTTLPDLRRLIFRFHSSFFPERRLIRNVFLKERPSNKLGCLELQSSKHGVFSNRGGMTQSTRSNKSILIRTSTS